MNNHSLFHLSLSSSLLDTTLDRNGLNAKELSVNLRGGEFEAGTTQTILDLVVAPKVHSTSSDFQAPFADCGAQVPARGQAERNRP